MAKRVFKGAPPSPAKQPPMVPGVAVRPSSTHFHAYADQFVVGSQDEQESLELIFLERRSGITGYSIEVAPGLLRSFGGRKTITRLASASTWTRLRES